MPDKETNAGEAAAIGAASSAPHTPAPATPSDTPRVDLVIPPASSSSAASAAPTTQPPAPDASAAPEVPRMRADIEKILKGVKLPERRLATPGSTAAAPAPQSPAPKQMEVPPVLSSPEIQRPAGPEDKSPVVALHTFKDDLQGAVKDQHISLIRAASMEQDKKIIGSQDAGPGGAQQRSSRIFGILFASITLIILGFAALFGVYIVMKGGTAGNAAPQFESIVFAETSGLLQVNDVTASDIKQRIAAAKLNGGGALGSILRIVPVFTSNPVDGDPQTRAASIAEFFASLGAHPPDELLRALGNDFFFGIHTVDRNSPVMVIPVMSYERAFAGMLAWEPSIDTDLAPIFPAVSQFTTGPDGLPAQRVFSDAVMRNYDARVLKDDNGSIVLYYSFPTPSILILAESPYSFTEILSRLQSARKL